MRFLCVHSPGIRQVFLIFILLEVNMSDYIEETKNLPLVLKVEDLMRLLSVSRNAAYALVKSGTIRSVRIGRSYRVPRDAFLEYLQKTS